MSERTKTQLLQEFRQRAKDDPADAKHFFVRAFIGAPAARAKFFDAVGHLASSYDGATYQTGQTFEKMLERIKDGNIRMIVADLSDELFPAPASVL